MADPFMVWGTKNLNTSAQLVLAKRLGLLHALVPKATRVAILVNPANGPSADTTLRTVQDAARSGGIQTKLLKASTSAEIDAPLRTWRASARMMSSLSPPTDFSKAATSNLSP